MEDERCFLSLSRQWALCHALIYIQWSLPGCPGREHCFLPTLPKAYGSHSLSPMAILKRGALDKEGRSWLAKAPEFTMRICGSWDLRKILLDYYYCIRTYKHVLYAYHEDVFQGCFRIKKEYNLEQLDGRGCCFTSWGVISGLVWCLACL